MWIVILITLLAFLILEYIIPFGRNVKGIENSSKAYYKAQSWIEQALLFKSLSTTTTWASTWVLNNLTFTNQPVAYSYNIAGNGNILPPAWEWNSEYDDEWNTIAPGQPIQLEIGNLTPELDWWEARFYFRIPDIGATNRELEWWDGAIINWQIWSSNDLLSASGSWITADEITNDTADGIIIWTREWATLESGPSNISDFYDTNNCATLECTLKFSIVNPRII